MLMVRLRPVSYMRTHAKCRVYMKSKPKPILALSYLVIFMYNMESCATSISMFVYFCCA